MTNVILASQELLKVRGVEHFCRHILKVISGQGATISTIESAFLISETPTDLRLS